MIKFKSVLTLWVIMTAFTFISAKPACCGQAFLYLYTDPGNVGEYGQIKSVARDLQRLSQNMFEEKEFSVIKQEDFLKAVADDLSPASGNSGVVLASERHSIEVLKRLKPQSNLVIAHFSHQLTKDHQDLTDIADLIALPTHTLSREDKDALSSAQTSVAETIGVAHNLEPEAIKEAYAADTGKIPDSPEYMGVILGGDAPTPEGEMLYYTEAEAQKLARYIAAKMAGTDKHLLILNGPRTGKHEHPAEKGKPPQISPTHHRDRVVDPVTQAFVAQLEAEKLVKGRNFTLFDFQYDQPSDYKTVLGVLLVTKSPLLIAGESTSMVSEAVDCLSKGSVTAYFHGAMNENHHRHCLSENEAGRIRLLENTSDEDWREMEANPSDDIRSGKRASEVIAEAVYKRFKEKTAGLRKD